MVPQTIFYLTYLLETTMTSVVTPTSQRVKRKTWTTEITLAFLECYLSRKDEFQHIRKKRFAYERILKEMVSRGLLDSSTTHIFLETRMHTLQKAYRAGKLKDKEPQLLHYMDLIFAEQSEDPNDDNMYEDKTMSSIDMDDEKETEMDCNYKERDWSCPTINLGGIPTNPLGDDSMENDFPSSSADLAEFLNSPVDIKPDISSRCTSPANPSLPHKSKKYTTPSNGMKRLSREMYYAEKLELNGQQFEARMQQKRKMFNDMLQTSERRFREAEKAKAQRHREKMDLFRRLLLK